MIFRGCLNLFFASFQLSRKWFPAKEASLKRGYILELLYNLHKGHDPSILQANSKSKRPHSEVFDIFDLENESKNEEEICSQSKPVDGSSSSVTYIPKTKTSSPDLILSKETFYSGGYDPETCKRRKVFMSPIEVNSRFCVFMIDYTDKYLILIAIQYFKPGRSSRKW